MKTTKDNYFKIIITLFLIWMGFCAYQFSQNGRYEQNEAPRFNPNGFFDTRTGNFTKY